MTYCFAWKKENKVSLIADSLKSTLSDKDFIEYEVICISPP